MLDIAIKELEKLIEKEDDEYKRFELKSILGHLIVSKESYNIHVNALKEQINELIKTNYADKKDS